MSKIRLLLPLLVLGGVLPAWGQLGVHITERIATFSVRRTPTRTTRPVSLQTVKHGPEPALPDASTNPIPAAVADRPRDTLLRRRKLRVRFRA